ncbi:hypothetical protein N665_0163s0085 [Sinapis alba]|nr:hypothetical protein N665_0163s0085 [Sinapis alba]
MNLSTDQVAVAADELAPPSQPHRLSTSCDVHPEERFSGFCPSCLCERLSVLDHNGAPPQPSSSSRKPSTAALKALFKPSSGNNNANGSRGGFFPELRRSKSFSAKNNEGMSGGLEPQRRSCDVRLREENRNNSTKEAASGGKREEEEEEKAMKEYMDLYPQTKKPSVRDFFSAASKKLQKWRLKQKIKKPRLPVEKATRRPEPTDTQSEIADYGFGRRSSDTDPRFSVDIGRISVDEPRASWDGHLSGRTTLPPLARVPPPPSMLSVAPMHRSDMQMPVEDPSSVNGESDPIIIIPGGSTQTRDYYTEPPRRKSLDRSNSIKKAMEMESSGSNAPAAMENKVKSKWGKWSMLGFIYRKGVISKEEEEEDRYSRSNSTGMVVERSLSESWSELRKEGGPSKMRRSNSNVSWRSSGGGSSRNKSSSKDGDNGMLRFYLTPTWRNAGGGGGGSGWEKTAARANSHGHSIAKRVMRLY